MLKIGSLKLKSNLILAPMSGVSDLPFRMLNRRFGCELAFVEMINVRSLGHKSLKTKQLLSTGSADRPLGVQILGADEKFILRGLEVLGKYKFDILDFNAACPARKVTRRGEGASLLKDPQKIGPLLKLIVKNSTVPVTMKIRTGWDKDTINAREVAKIAEDSGIDGLFIHGRNKTQEYSGRVDYAVIREVKKAVKIPVIASGDVFSPGLAKKMLDETGSDGLLLARGTFGNPWIFKEVAHSLRYGNLLEKPEINVVVDTMLEHFAACVDFYGPRVSVTIFRKFFAWYTKGFQGVRPLREKVNSVKTRDEMVGAIDQCRLCHKRIEHKDNF